MRKKIASMGAAIIIAMVFLSGCTETPDVPVDETYEETAIRLTGYLSNGEYSSFYSSCDSAVKAAITEQQLIQAWESVIISYGAFENIVSTRNETVEGYMVVYVTCTFNNSDVAGLLDLRYVFNSDHTLAGFQFVPVTPSGDDYTPPTYANTELFTEENVTIGTNPWILPATLSLPKGEGPFVAVVLVHGSGPNDRDETIYSNKPFKDLAWGLATQRIAVIRYDKRTNVYPEQCAEDKNFTVQQETVDDALAAVTYLLNRPDIDPDYIYIIGHSLGAMMTPEILNQNPTITGGIMLAAPARHLQDLMLEQYTYLFGLDGNITEEEQQQLDELQAKVDLIDEDAMPPGEPILGAYPPYWKDLNAYDQVAVAENLTRPLLILQGDRDYQVSPERDFGAWERAFNGSDIASLRLYMLLNHLFIAGEGQPTNTEYLIPGNVAGVVVEDILWWLENDHTLRPLR